MKKIIIPSALIALFFVLQSFTLHRTPIQHGSITYEVKEVESENLDPISKMMINGSKMTISFQDQTMRTEFKLPFIKNTTIVNGSANKGLTLVEKFTSKVAVPIDQNYFDQQKKERGKVTVSPKPETKEILGFSCKRMLVKAENGGEVEMYMTPQIQPQRSDQRFQFDGMKGFPLQMELYRDGNKLTFVAVDFDEAKKSSDWFSLSIPNGFSIKGVDYLAELKQKMRGEK